MSLLTRGTDLDSDFVLIELTPALEPGPAGIPSFRLPQSPAVSERQHGTEPELPAAEPSTSQPAAPLASAAAGRPLSGAARPSPFLGQSGPTITGLWGVKSSPAGSVSSLSRQASAERRSSGLFAQPGQSAGVPFAAKAQPAHQSRFGQQGECRWSLPALERSCACEGRHLSGFWSLKRRSMELESRVFSAYLPLSTGVQCNGSKKLLCSQ